MLIFVNSEKESFQSMVKLKSYLLFIYIHTQLTAPPFTPSWHNRKNNIMKKP
jgi:hypothetical protein